MWEIYYSMEAAESKIKVPVIGEGFPSAFKMATSCCKLVGQRVRDGHLDSFYQYSWSHPGGWSPHDLISPSGSCPLVLSPWLLVSNMWTWGDTTSRPLQKSVFKMSTEGKDASEFGKCWRENDSWQRKVVWGHERACVIQKQINY